MPENREDDKIRAMYDYDNVAECKEAGDHLNSCDRDGFCNYCGHQTDENEEEDNE